MDLRNPSTRVGDAMRRSAPPLEDAGRGVYGRQLVDLRFDPAGGEFTLISFPATRRLS